MFGDNGTWLGRDDPDGDDENWDELQTTCPIDTSTTSSTIKTASATSITPEPSPYETGDPMKNEVSCYDKGENTEHVRMDNAGNSFCNIIEHDHLVENYYRSIELPILVQRRSGHRNDHHLARDQAKVRLDLELR